MMETNLFINGQDIVQISGNKPTIVSCTLNIEEDGDNYLVEIPSLQIYFAAKSQEEIDTIARGSITSFFKVSLDINGFDHFLETMMKLGFTKIQAPSLFLDPSLPGELEKNFSRKNLVISA